MLLGDSLWKKLFMVKAHKSRDDMSICDGADIQPKPKTGYFKLSLLDIVKRW